MDGVPYIVYGPASRLTIGVRQADDAVTFEQAVEVPAYYNAMAAWVKYGHGGLSVLSTVSTEKFEAMFDPVAAAGGLALSPDDDKALIIVRNGIPDLPKGKRDPGETDEQAALREVSEETGVPTPALLRPLTVTRHIYRDAHNGGRWTLKTTRWFLMRATQSFVPRPQIEEGVTQVEFVPLDRLITLNTYPSVIEVVRAFLASRIPTR
ncbi:MAG: NUDIX domain-containing protein [Bacteroidia bacterium]|nr:NUDIX domain-containing protein [Bacteroidia bacterium]MDW8332602.1 NUDIX domain-containing protein [Bacteroidia bacterium]